jgi:methionyl-tRNA formyltransferase
VGIITQPDRPAGRGKKLRKNPVTLWAEAHGIPVLQPEKVGENELAWIKAHRVDLNLVMAFGQLLKKDFLEAPVYGSYNFHVSILPAYRGTSPVATSIALGDSRTGVTLMKMELKMDAGPIVDVESVSIDARDTVSSVNKKLSEACIPLIERNLKQLASTKVVLTPQDETRVSYVRKITKEDGALDFSQPAHVLDRRIRAFDGWPGSYIQYGETRIKVGTSTLWDGDDSGLPPGTVIGEASGYLLIQANPGILAIETLQRPGGKFLPAPDFLRGFPMQSGVLLTFGHNEPLLSSQPFSTRKNVEKNDEIDISKEP